MPLELWLDGLDEPQRRAAEAVLAVVKKHRGLVVEAVSVGVLIKRERTIAELRAKKKWLDLSLVAGADWSSERFARKVPLAKGFWYVVHLRDPRDVDRDVRGWLDRTLRIVPDRHDAGRKTRR